MIKKGIFRKGGEISKRVEINHHNSPTIMMRNRLPSIWQQRTVEAKLEAVDERVGQFDFTRKDIGRSPGLGEGQAYKESDEAAIMCFAYRVPSRRT